MSTVDFSTAQARPFIRKTKVTDGLLVTGEVKSAHLHQIFGTDNLANINVGYAQIFAATDRYHGKPLVGMTEAKGKVKMIHSHGFRYELSGGAAQAAKITKVLNTDLYPGVNNSIIDIVVDKPYFNVSDIIIPEDQEYRWKVVTKDGSRQHRKLGPNQFQYSIQLTTNNPQFYMPRHLLEENKEWRKVSSAVADEANIDGGGFQFYSIFQNEGFVQQHSVKLEVTDKTARKAKAFADAGNFTNNDLGRYADSIRHLWTEAGKLEGKPIAGFMSMLDAEMFNTLYSNVENTLTYGQESSIMYSPEGYQIYTASGLREQLKATTSLEHNGNLTLQELEDWMDSVLKDKVNDGECKIVISSGREWRKMFDRMIKSDSGSFLTLDTTYIRKGKDFRHMDYGSYFAEYQGFTVSVSVLANPNFDNRAQNPKMHPVKVNTPVDSWRGEILDFGMSKQDSGITDNINMVSQEWCNYHITYNGKWRAFDGKSGLPITDGGLGFAGGVSGYSVMAEKSAGLMVTDITRCGSTYLVVADASAYSVIPSAAAWWLD